MKHIQKKFENYVARKRNEEIEKRKQQHHIVKYIVFTMVGASVLIQICQVGMYCCGIDYINHIPTNLTKMSAVLIGNSVWALEYFVFKARRVKKIIKLFETTVKIESLKTRFKNKQIRKLESRLAEIGKLKREEIEEQIEYIKSFGPPKPQAILLGGFYLNI